MFDRLLNARTLFNQEINMLQAAALEFCRSESKSEPPGAVPNASADSRVAEPAVLRWTA